MYICDKMFATNFVAIFVHEHDIVRISFTWIRLYHLKLNLLQYFFVVTFFSLIFDFRKINFNFVQFNNCFFDSKIYFKLLFFLCTQQLFDFVICNHKSFIKFNVNKFFFDFFEMFFQNFKTIFFDDIVIQNILRFFYDVFDLLHN